MTDPNPTRAEVGVILNGDGAVTIPRATLRKLAAENQALRERAEAAERTVERLDKSMSDSMQSSIDNAERYVAMMDALTEARAQAALAWEAGRDAQRGKLSAVEPPADLSAALTARLDAEWNAAIEAAAKDVEEYGASFGSYNPSEPREVASDIRALRRAAPTEGEA